MSRIQIKDAADMLGVSARSVRAYAASGVIPGAAKIGKVWTFDRARLTAYIKHREVESCRTISTAVGGPTMGESTLPGATIEEAYTRLAYPSRAKGARSGLSR